MFVAIVQSAETRNRNRRPAARRLPQTRHVHEPELHGDVRVGRARGIFEECRRSIRQTSVFFQ